jgi:hypothetical protein
MRCASEFPCLMTYQNQNRQGLKKTDKLTTVCAGFYTRQNIGTLEGHLSMRPPNHTTPSEILTNTSSTDTAQTSNPAKNPIAPDHNPRAPREEMARREKKIPARPKSQTKHSYANQDSAGWGEQREVPPRLDAGGAIAGSENEGSVPTASLRSGCLPGRQLPSYPAGAGAVAGPMRRAE